MQHTCLGLLWSQNYRRVVKKCEVKLSKSRETTIVHLKQNTFAISTYHNNSFLLSCKDQEHKNINFILPKIFTLKKDCKLVGDDFLIEDAHSGPLVTSNEIIEYPTIGKTILYEPIKDHSEGIKAMLDKSQHIKKLNLEDLKQKINKKIKDDNNYHWHNINTLYILLGGLIVIVVDIITIITMRKFSRLR